MENEKKSGFRFNSVDLLLFAWEKRVPLVIISAVAAILSIIMSFRITELYKSSVILFPAPSTSVSKYLMSSQYSGRQALLEFGAEEESEQLLQILSSDDIRSWIINRYNLMEHYKIKPDSKYKYTQLNKKMGKYITFKRTKFRSVQVEVMDANPDTAAMIANDIAAMVDTVMNRVKRERAQKALQIVQAEYNDLERTIFEAEDSLDVLRNIGIFHYESQAEVLSDGYANAITEGNMAAAREINAKLDLLAKYGGAYFSISSFVKFEKEKLSRLKEKLVEAKIEAEETLPQKYVVNSAYPAERKSYPKKSLIVIRTTLGAFFFTYLLLLIVSQIKNRRDELKLP